MKKVVLVVLDGFGVNPVATANAVTLAKKPNFDKLWSSYPRTLLNASAEAVGLPARQIGGSEVGHMHLSAGRIIQSDLTYIDNQIASGDYLQNAVLKKTFQHSLSNNKKVHILGLLSDGGVHSSMDHALALLDMAKANGQENVYFHCLLDGRDVGPKSAKAYVEKVINKIKEVGTGQIATISGRYYGMDRDKRWERVQKAYDAMVLGEGRSVDQPMDAIDYAYENGETDEFVIPTVIKYGADQSQGKIENGDYIIGFNFRGDRMRQLYEIFLQHGEAVAHFPNPPKVNCSGFMQYADYLDYPVVFSREKTKVGLGHVLADAGMRQLRIAESEKYPHVTFFFNVQSDEILKNEERIKVPSQKVPFYNQAPEMSAVEVADQFIEAYKKNDYDFALINFANPDMVGHTGDLEASIKAIECVDKQLGKIMEKCYSNDTTFLVTADHGNSEEMMNFESNEPHTAHTLNAVPFIYVDQQIKPWLRMGGGLSNVAPTVLQLFKKELPDFMDKESLVLTF